MNEPLLSEQAFLADVDDVRRRTGIVDLWWLGQSGFLIHYRGRWVLVDPYLSDSLTEKYEQTDKPHVRMARRVIDPVELAKSIWQPIAVTSSHAHTDHLDPGTLQPLFKYPFVDQLIVPRSILQTAIERVSHHRTEFPPMFVGMDDGSKNQINYQIKMHAIASAHETVEVDEAGHCKYLGYVFEFSTCGVDANRVGWGTKTEFSIYHSGDTILYDGLVEKLRPFKVDIALLPINGRSDERRVAGNLWGREAAWLAKKIGAKLVIPCHYDMFEFNTATPDEFVAECDRLKQPYRVLKLGERFSSDQIPGAQDNVR